MVCDSASWSLNICTYACNIGFPWETLERGAVVVDVGGGIGTVSMLLAEKFEGLRFLVQDRSQVVELGEAVRFSILTMFMF